MKIRKEPSATAARERWEPYWQYVGNQVPRPGGPRTNHEPGKNIKTYFFLNIWQVMSSPHEQLTRVGRASEPGPDSWESTANTKYLALVKTWLTCFGTKFWSASLWDRAGGPSLSVSAGWGSGWCETPSLARESDIWNTRQI